jgi:hypothetical protein
MYIRKTKLQMASLITYVNMCHLRVLACHREVYKRITTLIIYWYENCPDNIDPKPLDSHEGM